MSFTHSPFSSSFFSSSMLLIPSVFIMCFPSFLRFALWDGKRAYYLLVVLHGESSWGGRDQESEFKYRRDLISKVFFSKMKFERSIYSALKCCVCMHLGLLSLFSLPPLHQDKRRRR